MNLFHQEGRFLKISRGLSTLVSSDTVEHDAHGKKNSMSIARTVAEILAFDSVPRILSVHLGGAYAKTAQSAVLTMQIGFFPD